MLHNRTVLVGRDHTLGETLDSIASNLTDSGIKITRLPAGDSRQHCQVPEADMAKYLNDAAVIVVSSRTVIDKQIIQHAPHLRGIVFPSIGYNSCDIDAATQSGVAVVNGVTAENYEGMAEGTVMMMSAAMLELRKKQEQLTMCQQNPPSSQLTSRLLKGKVVGLIGYGRIARETIKRLQGWGIDRFLVHTRSRQGVQHSNVHFCDLDTLLRHSDLVSIHCPLTPQTRHLIGHDELVSMKPEAVLVNTSRGGIIDEEALYHALHSQEISAAAIDTFENEPLSVHSPLRRLSNIYLTPHNIGHTRELFDSLVPKALENIFSLLRGELPADTVNATGLFPSDPTKPESHTDGMLP